MASTLLLIRPLESAQAFLDALRGEGYGGEALFAPLMEIVRDEAAMPSLEELRGVVAVFSSSHGVCAAPEGGGRALCVGEGTARAARRAGFRVLAHAPTSRALADWIANSPLHGPLLHLRGAHIAHDLTSALATKGITCRSRVVYEARPCCTPLALRTRLGQSAPVVVALFSPRSAALLGKALSENAPVCAPLLASAISPKVTQSAREIGIPTCVVAHHPNRAGMLKATRSALELASRVETRERSG